MMSCQDFQPTLQVGQDADASQTSTVSTSLQRIPNDYLVIYGGYGMQLRCLEAANQARRNAFKLQRASWQRIIEKGGASNTC